MTTGRCNSLDSFSLQRRMAFFLYMSLSHIPFSDCLHGVKLHTSEHFVRNETKVMCLRSDVPVVFAVGNQNFFHTSFSLLPSLPLPQLSSVALSAQSLAPSLQRRTLINHHFGAGRSHKHFDPSPITFRQCISSAPSRSLHLLPPWSMEYRCRLEKGDSLLRRSECKAVQLRSFV